MTSFAFALSLALLAAQTAGAQSRPQPGGHSRAPDRQQSQRDRGSSPQAESRAERRGAETKAESDAQIERNFRDRLSRSTLARERITFQVQDGVVTIEGTTEVIQRKGAATRMAKTAGAVKVVNNIRLSEEAREKAAANLAKGRRRAQVKRSEAAR